MYKRTPEKREPKRVKKRFKTTGIPKEGVKKVPPVTFVGGTGRSGTHVVSRLLASHGKLQLIPVECRFHVEERGFPGLLAGTTTKAAFLRRLRGFWWRGFQTNRMRGMYRFVPRARFDEAVEAFDERFEEDPVKACRFLFWDLLWPSDVEGEVSGIVEQSCDTVAQGEVLHRLFPQAAFVHVVRDGRDASASRVSQTRGLIYPRTRAQGLDWWEERMRAIDVGARAIPDSKLVEMSLDELLANPSEEALGELFDVVRLSPGRRVKGFFDDRMSPDEANTGRWRRGLSEAKRERLDDAYRETLDRLEADGVSAASLLRRTYDRRREADGGVSDAGTTPELVFVGGTGRSGTHVVASLLGEHSRYAAVPIECRFHCNPNGLADLVTGQTTPEEFVQKLRRFWWHRVRVRGRGTVRLRRLAARRGGDEAKVRGLHKITTKERLDESIAAFEASVSADVVAASRELFFSLLGPLAAEEGKPALVEMSCFTIASAPGLAQIFPEARFVHSVRDGRDSGSSKVSKRQKRHHPTDAATGIDWWEGRLRLAEEGVRGLGDDAERLHVVCLDELVWGDRDATYDGLQGFLGIDDEPGMRTFFEDSMSAGAAHRERWREGLDDDEQREVQTAYEAALERIERDGFHCAGVLRRSFERGAVAEPG